MFQLRVLHGRRHKRVKVAHFWVDQSKREVEREKERDAVKVFTISLRWKLIKLAGVTWAYNLASVAQRLEIFCQMDGNTPYNAPPANHKSPCSAHNFA